MSSPFVVYLRNVTGGVGILNDFDLGLRVWHDRRLAYLLQQRREGSIESRFDGAQIQQHLVFMNASHHGRLKPAKRQQKCLGLQYRVTKRNSCALKPGAGRCSPADQQARAPARAAPPSVPAAGIGDAAARARRRELDRPMDRAAPGPADP